MRAAVICIDNPGHLQVRLDTRPAHLAYMQETGLVEMAGPFLNEAGEMIGSMVILTVDTLEQAQSWAANDPYAKAGLFDTVTIREWKKVVG